MEVFKYAHMCCDCCLLVLTYCPWQLTLIYQIKVTVMLTGSIWPLSKNVRVLLELLHFPLDTQLHKNTHVQVYLEHSERPQNAFMNTGQGWTCMHSYTQKKPVHSYEQFINSDVSPDILNTLYIIVLQYCTVFSLFLSLSIFSSQLL